MTEEERIFSGGVAVITGAGSGIGRGLARRCGQIGMTVIVTDIDKVQAEKVAAGIVEAGGKAEAIQVDVAKPEALDQLAQDVFDRYGTVRLLVNNAGIETMGFSWEISPARWESTVNINILGVVHGVRAFVPHMLRVGQEAWIGNLASIGSFGQMPGQTAYIMTKHAVQAFSEGLYLEMQIANAPINVSSIVPGTTRTGIFDATHAKDEPESAAKYRAMMSELAANYGIDADDAACMYIEQMAARRFWVGSQMEMVKGAITSRIAFLEEQKAPSLSAEQRHLLGL